MNDIYREFGVDVLRDSENAGPTGAEMRMAEEIARFRAENIHLRRAGMDRPAELRAEIARLRARVEVLERDASRYQWLKNRKWMSLQTSYMKWIRKDSTSFIASHDLAADGTQYAPYETLDETIDAAMKEANS
jgi:type II secretory pathway component PulJ